MRLEMQQTVCKNIQKTCELGALKWKKLGKSQKSSDFPSFFQFQLGYFSVF